MSKKPKFKPEITRIKLNPEQAVLQCTCFDTRFNWDTDEYDSSCEAALQYTWCYLAGERKHTYPADDHVSESEISS